MAKRPVTTATTIAPGRGTYKVTCTARGKELILDEPVAQGGSDLGMNPVEALLAALGACKCVMVKAYGQAQGMDITEVAIEVTGTLDSDGSRGLNPDAKVGFSEISTAYRFTTSNTAAEVESFITWVDTHCPVQDTIVNPPTFSHTVVLDRP